MPLPPRPNFNFSSIPDPDTLSPEVREELLSQPWFNKVLDLQRMGIEPTPERMEKIALQPGAMGYKPIEIDLGSGRKATVVHDVSTGELIPMEKFAKPDFVPRVHILRDENGKKIGRAMATSPNSAIPMDEPQEPAMRKSGYESLPALKPDGSVLGHWAESPDGKFQLVKEGADMAALIDAFNNMGGGEGGRRTPPSPQGDTKSPTPPAVTVPAPAPVPAQKQPIVHFPTTRAHYDSLPSGALYQRAGDTQPRRKP